MSQILARVGVIGTLRFAPEKIADLLPHLQTIIETTRRLDGCIAYNAAPDPFEPGLVHFSELWPDEATLQAHLQAPHMQPWRAAVRDCGLLARHFTVYDLSGERPL